MKKLISIFLVLVMIFALVGTTSAETGTPTFVISEETAAPGEEVRVTVSVRDNTGFCAAKLYVQYDEDVLEWTDVVQGEYTTGTWSQRIAKGFFKWVGGHNDYHDGVFATLVFNVKADAPAGDTTVTVTYNEDDVFRVTDDLVEVNTHFDIQAGKVTVTESEPAATPTFVISEETAAPGEEVRVTVSVRDNTGFCAAKLYVQYDEDVLEWTDVVQGEYTTGTWSQRIAKGFFKWVGGHNDYHDGVFATLVFNVKADAPAGDTTVTVTYNEDDVFRVTDDLVEVNTHFDIQAGKVTVVEPETAYYLIGSMTNWQVNTDAAYKFVENPNAEGEYMLETTLAIGDKFKAVSATGTVINTWYPEGENNDYVVDEPHSGNVTIFFRPNYSGGDDWHYHCLYIQDEPAFKSQSLLLEGDIGVRFYVYLPQRLRNDSTNVSFTIDCKNGDKYAATVPYSEDLKTNSKGYYGFTFYVNTIQMADTITATLNYGEGEKLEKTYSVKEYFESFDAAYEVNAGLYTDDIMNLIKATADLGHYVQLHLDEARTEWSVENGDHKAMDKFYETNIASFLSEATEAVAGHALTVSGSNSDIKKLNYKVNFESRMSIHMIVVMKSGFSGTLSATADGTACNITQQTATKFLVEIPNVQAHQLSHKYTINITTENGTLTLNGSGLSYAKMMLDGANGNTVTQNAAIAFYRYSKFADVVKGNPSDIDKVNGSSNN